MILSNQVRCHGCGDEPYSSNRHDMASCSCGKVSVDGGMAYILRVTAVDASFTDMSIIFDDEAATYVCAAIEDGKAQGFDEKSIAALTLTLLASKGIQPVHTETVDDHKIQSAVLAGVRWGFANGRNGIGILCAVARYVRDAGSGWQGAGVRDADT